MQVIKKSYVRLAQAAGASAPGLALTRKGAQASHASWTRWTASLFAIYNTERMVELDLPWWNVAATEAVTDFLSSKPHARVFETGAGASTVWLSRRTASVVSVEHDEAWFDRFRTMVAGHANIDLRFRPVGNGGEADAYVHAIDETADLYDLIVVDGRQRVACLQRAIAHLAPGGMILFDDSGRDRYRKGIEGCGLNERRYFGRSYCVPYPDHTSLLTRQG